MLIQPILLALVGVGLTSARDITFPPSSGYVPSHHHQQNPLAGNGDEAMLLGGKEPGLLVPSGAFAGLTTFANLPYVNCLAEGEVERYDVAFLGAPFDTVSHGLLSDCVGLWGEHAVRSSGKAAVGLYWEIARVTFDD